ncbi:unnamed protein product [Mytilus coruscus]|uniref:MULE transposase domain-containing protein n=1 Tax=Mytilus coruscus TaxID=42192 RepID=A0A6J8AXB2_MYTCO|nr:unnamed protein product [Mytilus coruscus]
MPASKEGECQHPKKTDTAIHMMDASIQRKWLSAFNLLYVEMTFTYNWDSSRRLTLMDDHPFFNGVGHQAKDLILSANIKRQMTAAVADDPTLTIREAYDDVAHQFPLAERGNIPTYANVRSSLDQLRRRYLPEIPASINDVDIGGRWRVTLKGNRFPSKLDNAWALLFFARHKHSAVWVTVTISLLMLHLNQHQVLTSNSLPFMDFFRERVIPLVFALMTDRNVANYRQILGHLKRSYARLTNNQPAPINIISDYATGIMTAAHTDFPNVRIIGCFFLHSCKSIWTREQQEGLRRPYNRSPRLKRCIR